MKVHLIKKETLEIFADNNARSRISLEDWLAKVKAAEWESPEDILYTFRTADLLGNGSDRVIFDIAGNHYRMICKYWFGTRKVHLYIKWIGTHAAYSKLCKRKDQYTIDSF